MEMHSLRTFARSVTATSFLLLLLGGAAPSLARSGPPGSSEAMLESKAVESCQILLPDLVVTRGIRGFLQARLIRQGAFRLGLVEWRFTGGDGGVRQTGRTLSTGIKLVDTTQQYTATVIAFSQTPGVYCFTTARVHVLPRPWSTIPRLRPDNEPGWGLLPVLGANTIYGEERDRASNTGAIVVPSPRVPNKSWERGYRVEQVIDPNGPNHGYFFVKNNNFAIDQETVINRWIKPNGRAPVGAPFNWFQANRACLLDPGVFVTAVGNHENSGSGPGSTGHFGLIRDFEALPGKDPQTEIENNVARTKAVLIADTNNELTAIEIFLLYYASEPFVGGNWPPGIGLSFWNPPTRSYTPCNVIFRAF